MRKTNEEGRELIRSDESLELVAYTPTEDDVPTIGWGHTRGVRMGDEIDLETAERFFSEDISSAERSVEKLVKVPLTDNQFAALVSLCFNIGEPLFAGSTLLKLLNKGAPHDVVVLQFARWNKQFNKKTGKYDELGGLTKRRAREAALYRKNNNEKVEI